MKSKIIFVLLIVICLQPFAREIPLLSSRVTDETMTLSSAFIQETENRLKIHEEETSNQVAILMINSLDEESIESFSIRVVEKWKLGQKGKNNGVLLLIAKDDRKLRIEVGYGLEGVLTDLVCRQIIYKEITPYFKNGNYEQGIRSGIDAILGTIKGEYKADATDYQNKNFFQQIVDSTPIAVRIPFGLIFLIIVFFMTTRTLISPIIGWFLYFFLMPFWLIPSILLLGVPFGFYLFGAYLVIGLGVKIFCSFTEKGREFARNYSEKYTYSSGGYSSDGSYSSWGSSSWGDSSGSSDSGFSGGGGDFGGGGSSGDW
ncbi:MAG TPA: YgcG family protein [Spirochaetota bacterium]|nr:YgcG family protein [Spirochaetota bacterium]